MDNLSGRVIKGYELREMIGMGGFTSVVYRASSSGTTPLRDKKRKEFVNKRVRITFMYYNGV